MNGHPEQTCQAQILKLPLSAGAAVTCADPRCLPTPWGWPPPHTCHSCVQGAFVDCASPAPVTATLATATVELLRSDHVHKHTQPYVRRAALVAAGQVRPAWSCSAAVLML